MTRRRVLIAGLVLAAAVAAAVIPGYTGSYGLLVAFEIVQLAALAQAWSLMAGYGGIVSLAVAAFVGIGSYGTAEAAAKAGLGLYLSVLAGGLVAVVFALAVAVPMLRFRGLYFTIGSLVLAEALGIFMSNFNGFGGNAGITLTGTAPSPETIYLLSFVVAAAATAVVVIACVAAAAILATLLITLLLIAAVGLAFPLCGPVTLGVGLFLLVGLGLVLIRAVGSAGPARGTATLAALRGLLSTRLVRAPLIGGCFGRGIGGGRLSRFVFGGLFRGTTVGLAAALTDGGDEFALAHSGSTLDADLLGQRAQFGQHHARKRRGAIAGGHIGRRRGFRGGRRDRHVGFRGS